MEPLASQLRPKNLEEFQGQQHLVGKDKPICVATEQKHLFSFILWGPPGCGKTTLAKIYANALDAELFELSAVSAGKADIKKIIEKENVSDSSVLSFTQHQPQHNKRDVDYNSTPKKRCNRPKVLFLDEIHRFNKAQQDFLLPFVESGEITLIGATTENPSFEVIAPLLSRCRVFVLNELTSDDMLNIIESAMPKLSGQTNSSALGGEAKDWLIAMANGDARQAIGMLENTQNLYKKINLENLKQTLQSKHLRYDKAGDEHYNTISAFIKSMRASQPNAAIYYLARMVDSGEDPKFIARRMVVFASEDIGLAVPTALVVANAVFRACETIGYPECAINLAHGVAYLCSCKKDRSGYNALRAAQKDVKEHGNLQVPMSIRNAPTDLMKDLGYGEGYEMYETDDLLPDKIKGKKYLN